jgi:hypothetical protein
MHDELGSDWRMLENVSDMTCFENNKIGTAEGIQSRYRGSLPPDLLVHLMIDANLKRLRKYNVHTAGHSPNQSSV